jgi:hypothetical protein
MGLAGFIVPVIRGHGALVVAFFRSMKLGKPPGFRIALKKNDNPELYFALKGICQKAGVSPGWCLLSSNCAGVRFFISLDIGQDRGQVKQPCG